MHQDSSVCSLPFPSSRSGPRGHLRAACLLVLGVLSAGLLPGCALQAIMTPERSYPRLEGEERIDGLTAPVTITRDAFGVPHIRAANEQDLWFAVGYVHAQDRLFQMDLVRRLGAGRLSEWLGPQAIGIDTFMRGLEIPRTIEKRLAGTDPQLLMVGEAYAAGVNAGAASLPALPVEYRVLGVPFEKWQLADAISSSIVNSWTLSENAPRELVTLLLRDRLDAQAADALWRWDPEAPPVEPYWDTLRKAKIGDLTPAFRGVVEFLWGVHDPTASNNWVVGPQRSADGAPILANDPHMMQLVPSIWYVFEGSGGGYHIAGACLAGTPFMATGHNEHVAWGVTNVMSDYVDLAVLERVGDRGYILAGEQKQLREVSLEIPVKGAPPARRTVYWTEVGPVITELEGTHLVALRWGMLESEDHTSDMFYAIQRAKTVDDVIAAAKYPSMISENLVAGDDSGNIAWQVFGSIPRRRGFTGQVPYPASSPDYGWDGWLTDLPGEKNPPRGYIRTANSRPDAPQAYAISTAYLPKWRYNRIGELLEARPQTPATFADIQLDVKDTHAAALIPKLLADIDPGSNACARILTDWDHDSGPDSIGATVWAVFQGELIREVLLDDLGEAGLKLYLAAIIPGRSVLDAGLERFVDDLPGASRRALVATEKKLEAALGPDPAQWRWGRLHHLRIRHPFNDQTSLLDKWSMPVVPTGGSHQTVNQSGYSWYNPTLDATWIASLRLITPLSNPAKATFVYPGGESGHPGHPYFSNLFETYTAGKNLPLYFSDEDVRANAVKTLVLRPGSGGSGRGE